ncbi:MAG: DUF3987 domain-containing protein [Hyphomicrobiales bacterium]|nr:DUF3987 domain-containing protein [Hyphomicrobiales bacterium]
MTNADLSTQEVDNIRESAAEIRSRIAASGGGTNVVQMPGIVQANPEDAPAMMIDSRVPDNARLQLPTLDERETFPVHQMPPLFRDSILELHDKYQVPAGIVGMVALSVAAFACQQHANVEAFDGDGDDVLSLFTMTIGGSGEGKGRAFGAYMRAIEGWAEDRAAQAEMQQDAWDARSVEAQKKLASLGGVANPRERQEMENQIIAELGPRPWLPMGMINEATAEGLLQFVSRDRPSAMLATEEASMFFGGFAMQAENRDKMRAELSLMWEGKSFSGRNIKRGKTGARGYRFSLMLAGQPQIMEGVLRKRDDMAQGFFPRILLSNPPSMRGFRERRRDAIETHFTNTFSERLLEIYSHDPHTDQSGFRILPTKIGWTDAARQAAFEADAAIEARQRPGGDLRPFGPIANRMMQMVARIAGIFAFMETARPFTLQVANTPGVGLQNGMHSEPITVEHLNGALAIVEYSLSQWRSVIEGGVGSSKIKDAAKIVEQLKGVRDRAVSNSGQPALRMGQFTWSAFAKAGVFKGLEGASDTGAEEYVKAEVLPYLVEKGHLLPRRTARGKPLWVLADAD